MRAFEQIRTDVCIMNQPVKIVGVGGGLSYGTLGPTHHSIVDLAILRSLPNMTVVCPCDPIESMLATRAATNYPGPIYIRLAKGYDPIVTNDEYPFKIGKGIPMREGKDALIISTGITLNQALEAADSLSKDGIETSVLHIHTIKPLDQTMILEYASKIPVIVTIEEHTIIGGLGGAVAEIIAEANFNPSKRFKRIGIPDVFADEYGSQASLMKRFNITADQLIVTIKQLLEQE